MLAKMSVKKSSTLNLRIDPKLKEALRVAAEKDHRSIANMLEVLIIRYCEDEGIALVNEMSKNDETL